MAGPGAYRVKCRICFELNGMLKYPDEVIMPSKALLLSITVLFLVSTSCRDSEQSAGKTGQVPDVVSVRVQTVQKSRRASVFNAGGTVEAREKVDLAFRVPGKVVQVHFKEGDAVRAQQVVAELYAVPFKQAVDAAIDKSAEARVKATRAEAKYRHMKRLYKKKSLSPSDFKKYETASEAAKAALIRAESRLRAARRRLTETRLTSPIKGVVVSRRVKPEQTVVAGYPAFTVVDIDRVNVRVTVPEQEIVHFRQGQSARVLIPSLRGRAFAGEVKTVGLRADPATGGFPLKIEVNNPKRILRDGMSAEVRIENDKTMDILTVPGKAVVRNDQGVAVVYVCVPEQKKVFVRPVETGAESGETIDIKKGLTGDERVVIEGGEHLVDGAVVSIVEQE